MTRLPIYVLLGAACGCAGHTAVPGGTAATAAPSASPARRNPNVISQEELASSEMRSRNVLDVVRSLRPAFLTERGKNSMTDAEAGKVHASINGIGVIPLDDLRNIQAHTVVEIVFLSPAAAMQRFGGAAREGPVIVVKTM